KLVTRYRKSINPPYNTKDVVNLFITSGLLIVFFVFAVIIATNGGNKTYISNAQSTTYLPGSVPGCQFQKADPGFNVAFCDTFDQPMGTGNRSGDLDGTVWGASRLGDSVNPGQGQYDTWYDTQLDRCGTTVTVNADKDIEICNSRLVEGFTDNGGDAMLAMYPKQPFDIAGRTGTVTFDVSADSQGVHAAWPTFFYTDQPLPDPASDNPPNIAGSNARNSFGIALDAYGNTPDNLYIGGNCDNNNDTGVGEMFLTRNYILSSVPFTTLNCVKRPAVPGVTADTSKVQGPLNHFEIRISQNHVEVWGTDPGSTVLKELAVADNVNLPLTRGVIWIEDAHYNANKFNNQRIHTFAWDNVGFDGPVLPRDSANDVLESKQQWNGPSSLNLGWATQSNLLTLTVPNIASADITQATGALLTMNWFTNYNTGDLKYRLNGNAWHTFSWPYAAGYLGETIGIPVALSEV
ncbi:MAG: hypothetical protein ACREBA_09615, partial [Nitrosotalea sp.]